jgi:secreted trypsin-like serine protease
MRKTLCLVAVAAATVLLGGSSATAVVGGTTDTTGRFPNVGVLQIHDGDEWFDFCSVTLVAPDVVLTAAHCTDFLQEVGDDGFGPADLRISFDAAPGASSIYHFVDHIVVNPAWFTAGPCFGNSKDACLSPGHEDIAPDRYLKITKSVCFGDSGGPLFHNGTIVALNTWTFSTRCDGPNLEYRVDSATAQAFLDANL